MRVIGHPVNTRRIEEALSNERVSHQLLTFTLSKIQNPGVQNIQSYPCPLPMSDLYVLDFILVCCTSLKVIRHT